MDYNWNSLIDASSAEIHRQARDLSLPQPVLNYAQVISSYLQGDVEKLEHCCREIEDHSIRELAHLRLAIRRHAVERKELERLADLEFQGLLEGERLFCLALAWESLGNDQMTCAHFLRAAAVYRANGCPSKGLRAHYNAIAAESRLFPHKNYVADYQAVIEASKAIGDRSFAGIARTMLSREYQIVGLLEIALEMVNQAILDLEAERGTVHYYHCLLQKAHVLMNLGHEIRDLLRETELAPFRSIQAARTLLLVSLDKSAVWERPLENDLLPTWKNRVPALLANRSVVESRSVTSELEQALLRLVYNGPIAKWDLITKLYPDETDSVILENRFKNLLARVRKKHHGALLCVEGRYSLAKMPTL